MKLKLLMLFIGIVVLISAVSCKNNTSITSSTTSQPTMYSLYELRYKLLAAYPDYFWCDPDLYPVARPGVEQQNAIDQFAAIQANQEEFSAILTHVNLSNQASYTDDEKLQIYREYKKLNDAVQMVPASSGYTFSIRTGQNQGKKYDGKISNAGVIKVTSETTSFNTCPICLAAGTLIDSPEGLIPVERLRQGMVIYTVDKTGKKITGKILTTMSVPVPESFKIINIVLNDGRRISASPSHPTTDGRVISELKAGDMLDGGMVVSVAPTLYSGSTYDVLPDGGTGFYWANGILLKSTLAE
jgi:hypothetical protein